MVEPNCCVTDGQGQSCLCGSSAFCSPVRDGDHSEPGAERRQGYCAKEDSGPGCEAVPRRKRVLVSMRTDSKVLMTALDMLLEEVRGCPALLLLPLGNVPALGAGTGGGERALAGHDNFAGVDMMWGHCPAAAAATGAAHEFRTVPGTIRMDNWWLFPQHQPCTVRGRQCKPGLVAGWTRG